MKVSVLHLSNVPILPITFYGEQIQSPVTFVVIVMKINMQLT